MNRYLYYGMRNAFHIPVWVADVARRNRRGTYFELLDNFTMVQKMARDIIRRGNVTVAVHGLENLPEQNGYALYANHQGFFDGLALLKALDEPFHFLVMEEMRTFPVVHYVMSLLDCIYMDRDDPKQSFAAIRECARFLEMGQNVLIFPEGTLETEKNRLLPMKAGAFKAASMAQCPIIPVALKNSCEVFTVPAKTPCEVTVTILPPLKEEDYRGWRTGEIAEWVQESIAATLRNE